MRQFHSHIVIIGSNEVLTLTLAQDFREARDWFFQHKRDPFLWLIILGPLTFFAINMWGLFVFQPSGAIRAINQVLPNAEVNVIPKNFPKCSGRTYSFGYDFHARYFGDGSFDCGRACRDIVKGVWVVDIFTFDSSNPIVPHPASSHALGRAPDYPKQ